MMRVNVMERGNVTAVVPDEHLCTAFSACPFCGSSRLTRRLLIQASPEIHFVACRCGCTFADRQPIEQYLRQYYHGYYDGDEVRTHIYPGTIIPRILPARFKSRRFATVLDFGGGDGSVASALVKRLQGRGLESAVVHVVDHNAAPLPDPPSHTEFGYFGSLDELPLTQQYDWVIASAVLEHVTDLRGSLKCLLRRLAKAGRFYARTPYALPLAFALKRVGITFDLNYPAHLFDLGPRFWSQAIGTLGLDATHRLVRSRTSPVETHFRSNPLRAAVSHAIKFPSHILGGAYPFAGGWEAYITRDATQSRLT